VLTAFPKYGPASRDQRSAGLRTPADLAKPRIAVAVDRDQLSRISGRIGAGTWL